MGMYTNGVIKGFVSQESILEYLKEKYDKNALSDIKREIVGNLQEIRNNYKVNKSSESSDNWYIDFGYITFSYKDKTRRLLYSWSNVTTDAMIGEDRADNLNRSLEDETVLISMAYWDDRIEIVKDIVSHFGEDWIDDNDCDTKGYYRVGKAENKIQ